MQAVRRFLLVAILALLSIAAAPGNPGTPVGSATPPNIILITLDTTRADRTGFLGSKRGLTPNLDVLAGQSVVFTRAYAQVPLTTPSHAALLTGTYPQFNHLEDLGTPLQRDLPFVPDLLHQNGYQTAAFVGGIILDPENGAASGFERGFDVYDAGFHYPKSGEDRYQSLERRAEDVANRALGWLSRSQQKPFFLWIHFYDPHDPYDPPAPFKTRYASAPYDGEIAYTDSVVGSIMNFLRRHELYGKSLIVVAADHGEAFGEHGEMRHGVLLYDETIHVPLLMKLPAQKFAGKRIDQRVALADVAPSLLEAAGIAVPANVQAQSLLPLIDASTQAANSKIGPGERAVYSETDYAHRTLGWSELRSWRAGKYLYVQAPREELYDQSSDPGALKNLAPGAKAIAGTLDAQLSDFRQRTSAAVNEQATIDPARAERLHALGYLASEHGGLNPSGKVSVDPKDKVGVVNQLQQAIVDLEEDRYDQAMAELRKVVSDPDAAAAYLEFGQALMHRKQYRDAVPLLRSAAEKFPDSVAAHLELGKALVSTGQFEAALPEMRAAAALKPEAAQLHFYVAAVQTRLKHLPEAVSEYEKALELDPDHFDANLTYGRVLLLQGHPDAALSRLSRAVKVNPESPEAHRALAEAYEKLGQVENATRERAEAEQLKPQTRQ